MYAVISDRGRQHWVEEGQILLLDLTDAEPGQTLEFDQVLLLGGVQTGPLVGQPTVAGAKVVASIRGEERMKKIHVRTFKRRKNFRRHRGHRQRMTAVEITQIVGPDGLEPTGPETDPPEEDR